MNFNGKSYLDIIKELKPGTKINEIYNCHLDPDLRKDTTEREYVWRPLFGQTGSSQGHLSRSWVTKGDLFLFFGTFRATELNNGKIRYVKRAPEIHMIFGYFQIGEIHSDFDSFKAYLKFHPHAQKRFAKERNNCIYEASEYLSFLDNVVGADCLQFHEDLVLSKEGYSKSRWSLPSFFRDIYISYHSHNSFTLDYFQSTAKGQEFVIEKNKKVQDWAKNLIIKGIRYN